MSIFDDLLTEPTRESAKKAVYDKWRSKHELYENVKLSKEGLLELLTAIKDTHEASKFVENDFEWHDDVKQQYDAIAFLLEEFVKEFKPMYKEMSNKHLAEKLTAKPDDNMLGTLAFVDNSHRNSNKKGWRTP